MYVYVYVCIEGSACRELLREASAVNELKLGADIDKLNTHTHTHTYSLTRIERKRSATHTHTLIHWDEAVTYQPTQAISHAMHENWNQGK